MSKRIEIEGKVFNRWTVGKYLYNKQNHSFYECTCACGTIKSVSGNYLRSGLTKSCGCYDSELKMSRSLLAKKENPNRKALSSIHHSMMQRCYDKRSAAFKNYGARGVMVIHEWHKQIVFIHWCRENGWRPGLDLNRIDNNGNYCPENCNFVTRKQNMNNTRKNIKITVNGKDYTPSQIADLIGRPYEWVRSRFRTRIGIALIQNEMAEIN